MAVIVPVGECVASFVVRAVGTVKDLTFGIGYKDDGVGPDLSPATMAESLLDNARAAGGFLKADFVANNFVVVGVRYYVQTVDGPLGGEIIVNETGTGGGAEGSANSAVLVTKGTGLGGRRNRGRWYVPPIMASFDVNMAGVIGSGIVPLFQSQLEDWRTAVELDGIELLLHHSDGSAGTRLESFTVQDTVGTQRRRIR